MLAGLEVEKVVSGVSGLADAAVRSAARSVWLSMLRTVSEISRLVTM